MYIESKNILFPFIFFKESFKLLIFHFLFWGGKLNHFSQISKIALLKYFGVTEFLAGKDCPL